MFTALWGGAVALVIYALLVGLMLYIEDELVFMPARVPRWKINPPSTYEDVTFTAPDGTRLHGWFLPVEKPRAVVLFAHGNAGNVVSWAFEGERLQREQHCSVLVFDYRGYGQSEGSPTEAGILADARAARRWLAERTGVTEPDIILAGRSLGTGVAIDLAAKDGAQGVVLISPYTSIPAVAAGRFPFIPANLLMRNRFDSLNKIRDYRGPVLIFHGEQDGLIPVAHGRQVFEGCGDDKEMVTFPGLDHNDLSPREYDLAWDRFLTRLGHPR